MVSQWTILKLVFFLTYTAVTSVKIESFRQGEQDMVTLERMRHAERYGGCEMEITMAIIRAWYRNNTRRCTIPFVILRDFDHFITKEHAILLLASFNPLDTRQEDIYHPTQVPCREFEIMENDAPWYFQSETYVPYNRLLTRRETSYHQQYGVSLTQEDVCEFPEPYCQAIIPQSWDDSDWNDNEFRWQRHTAHGRANMIKFLASRRTTLGARIADFLCLDVPLEDSATSSFIILLYLRRPGQYFR
ncbi:MAG: hypothetical protein MMC33_008896 [Icmadophila ericetorum]|nr:hypothetical protein [Icmadophila ericetorum]